MKTALITGGNRGIGLATARRLGQDGVHVVIGSRDGERGRTAVAALEREGHLASRVVLDVTDSASVRSAARTIADEHGQLDILVNNAGIVPEATNADPHEIVDTAMFRSTFETNVIGAVTVLEAVLPLLRQGPCGRIVNVSTTMGSLNDQTDPESPFFSLVMPAYQSSKAALNNITIALAKQLVGTPIKVTSVCPGFVQTDLTPVNRQQATLTADQAARVVHHAATLPHDAPSGTFFDTNGPVPW